MTFQKSSISFKTKHSKANVSWKKKKPKAKETCILFCLQHKEFALHEVFHGFSLQTFRWSHWRGSWWRWPCSSKGQMQQSMDLIDLNMDGLINTRCPFYGRNSCYKKNSLTRCWWYFLAANTYLRAVCVSPAGSWDQSTKGQSKTEKSLRIKRKNTNSYSLGRKITICKHNQDIFNMLVWASFIKV